ncbi:MAG: hypothetical protein LBB26_01385 [Puniceicoccales bacterium]|jgi:hypothetical protein|nr:hypothetical protein [Puniceicoccales bacterium]
MKNSFKNLMARYWLLEYRCEHEAFVWKPLREFDGFQPHTGEFNLQSIAGHIARLRDYLQPIVKNPLKWR